MAAESINYKNILAPVDGSKISEKLVEKAAAVAVRNETSLDLLYVIDTNSLSGLAGMSISGDVVYQLVQDAEEKLAKYQNLLKTKVLRMLTSTFVSVHLRRLSLATSPLITETNWLCLESQVWTLWSVCWLVQLPHSLFKTLRLTFWSFNNSILPPTKLAGWWLSFLIHKTI